MGGAVRLAVIGAGRIGRLHARNVRFFVPGARLEAVADVRVEAARELAAELGVERCYGDFRRMLEEVELDGVVVCSSTDTHAEVIEAAASAGRHVFCEKPIEVSLERIDRVLEAVKRHGVKLQVGFQRRFDPSVASLRRAVSEGEIGDLHLLLITSRDPNPPSIEYIRSSGGIFRDMTIHDFDVARFVVGDEVEEVYARGEVKVDERIGEAGDVDTALVVLRFRNGVLCSINNSRRAVYGYDQRVEAFGSRGMISTLNVPERFTLRGDERGFHTDLLQNFFVERYREAYVEEMRQFVEAIRGEREIPCTGRDGKMASALAEAATRSLREGRPVKLEEVL